MMISSIRLQHFRSYTEANFDFSDQVTIIVGPNASGKTNLLESILVVARGSSYRAKDHELIHFDDTWARLDAQTGSGIRTIKLVAEPEASKTYELGGKTYKRLSLQHTLPVVLFEPNHLMLLSGSPDQRRVYLDDLLEQTTPGYSALRRNYRRVLAQRNALLKRARAPINEELFPWNLRLSELGAAIARHRNQLSETIQANIGAYYQQIARTSTSTTLRYHSQFSLDSYESQLLHKLEASLSLDVARGFTAAGPHRDDFIVLFDDKPAAETASRGETRTFVLALKIIELEVLEQAREARPLLLLDDVFSELDATRRHALTETLANYQTFITTTDADVVHDTAFSKHVRTISTSV